MRVFAVCLLATGALPASTIGFSGGFYQGEESHGIFLSGGFSLQAALPDFSSNLGTCGPVCDASGTFRMLSASDPAGHATGQIDYSVQPFLPAACGAEQCPQASVPMTFTGEVILTRPDGSVVYDYPVSGSGILVAVLHPISGGWLINKISATVTGLANSPGAVAGGDPVAAPEPGTAALLLLGLSALRCRWLRRRPCRP